MNFQFLYFSYLLCKMPHLISMGSHFLLRPEKESRSHLDQIATTLGHMSTLEDYADVTLHFPGKIKIKTNKIVLSQSSKMLDEIFNTNCVCANGYQPVTYDILCPDLNPEAMQKILQILYQGRANLETESFFQEMLHILECLKINLPLQSMKNNGNNNKEVFDKVVVLDGDAVKMEPSNVPYQDLNCKYCDKHFSTTAESEKHYFEHIVAEDKTQSRFNQVETYLANHIVAEDNSSISSLAYELSNNIFMGPESVSIQGHNFELGPLSYESQDFEPVLENNSRSDLSNAQVVQPSNTLDTRVTWAKTSQPLANMSKPYICLTCNKQYKGEKSLLNHQQKHQISLKASIDLNASDENQTILPDFSFGNSEIETPTILLKSKSDKSQNFSGELNSNFLKSIPSILNKSKSDTNNEEHVKTSNFPISLNIHKRKLPGTNNKPTCKVSLSKLAHVFNPDSVSNPKDYPEEKCLSNEDISNSQSNVLSNVPAVILVKKKRGRPCKPNLTKTPAAATTEKFKIKQNHESPKKSRNHLKRGIKSKQRKQTLVGSKHSSKLPCILCHKLSSSFGNLLIHLSNAHYKDSIKKIFGEDKYKCGLCSKVILHESSMLYHLAAKHNSLKLCMTKENWLKVKELQSRKSTAKGGNKPAVEVKRSNQVSNENISKSDDKLKVDAYHMEDELQIKNQSESAPSTILSQNYEAKETKALKRKPKGIYKCHLCSHVSEYHNLFLSHMAVTHYQKELAPLVTKTDGECTQCHKVYSSKCILLKHLATCHNAIAHLIKDVSVRSEEPKSVTKQIKQHQPADNSLSNISNVSFEESCPIKDSTMPLKTVLPKRKLYEMLIGQSSEKENINNTNSLKSVDQQVELKTELDSKCNLCHQLFPNYDLLLRHYSHTHFKQDLKKFYGKVEGECRLCSNIMLNEDCLLQHLAISHNTLDKLIPEKHLLLGNIKSEIDINSKVLETAPLKFKEGPKLQPTIKRPALPEQNLTKRSNSKPAHIEDTKIGKSISQDIKTECALTKQKQKVIKLSKQKVTKVSKLKVTKLSKLNENKFKEQNPKKEDQTFDKEAAPKAVKNEKCEKKNLKSNVIKNSKKGSEDMTVYYCHMCPFQTGVYKKLPRHIGKVHLQDKVKEYYGSDKFSCSLCSETYTSEDFLINHIVAVHGVLSSVIPTQTEAASRKTKI